MAVSSIIEKRAGGSSQDKEKEKKEIRATGIRKKKLSLFAMMCSCMQKFKRINKYIRTNKRVRKIIGIKFNMQKSTVSVTGHL